MNKRKKLHELTKNVLPKSPAIAYIFIENNAEIELRKKADRIREKIGFDLVDFWHDNNYTFEQKQNKTLEIYRELDEQEKVIVSKDGEFAVRRLQNIMINYFERLFPKNCKEPLLRVLWFFNEMDNLAVAEYLEDSEWHHNRSEDDPEFDDYKWWDNLESKINKEFPDGIFTEKSFKKAEELYDETLSKIIREHWRTHPEEFERTIKRLKNS